MNFFSNSCWAYSIDAVGGQRRCSATASQSVIVKEWREQLGKLQ
ncbi:hypothetical protein ACRQDV_07400 [Actinotignum sp. GS-2025e]